MTHSEPFILSVNLLRERVSSFEQYPFSIPAIRHLERLELHPRVTFFVGENGTGKSTLLEAISAAEGINVEGGSRNFWFSTNDTSSEEGIAPIQYTETEHYKVTKAFLANPPRMLKELMQ